MPNNQLVLLCWPGLADLWLRGSARALLFSTIFSILLNVAAVSTFVWPKLFSSGVSSALWIAVGTVWLGSILFTYRRWPLQNNHPENRSTDSDALFIQAQTEYLKGHWAEAELLLRRQLGYDRRDIESRLMLATLFRHQRQFDFAEQQLEILIRFDEAQRWSSEIDRELNLLDTNRDEEQLTPDGVVEIDPVMRQPILTEPVLTDTDLQPFTELTPESPQPDLDDPSHQTSIRLNRAA